MRRSILNSASAVLAVARRVHVQYLLPHCNYTSGRRPQMDLADPANAAAFREWWASTDSFLVDCDGVIWRGPDAIAGVDATVDAIRAAGKRIFFVSNNATKTRRDFATKLAGMGIHAKEEEIASSAYATAVYLRTQGLHTRKVYCIGEAGLVAELAATGATVLGPEDNGKTFAFGTMRKTDLDPDVGSVVIGFDGAFCYYKLAVAASYIRYGGCRFIATNRDATFPDAHLVCPGGGSLVAALETATQRPPDVVVGKPSPQLLEILERGAGIVRSRTCMVGDRLDTDIQFGNDGGLASTLLVETGVNTLADVAALPEGDPRRPTFKLTSFGDLHHLVAMHG